MSADSGIRESREQNQYVYIEHQKSCMLPAAAVSFFLKLPSCPERSMSHSWLPENSPQMRQNVSVKYVNLHTHTDTLFQCDISRGIIIMTGVKPWVLPVPDATHPHASVEDGCLISASRHIAAPCSRDLIWDLPGTKNPTVCRDSQSAGSEPSLCSLFIFYDYKDGKDQHTPSRRKSLHLFISASVS